MISGIMTLFRVLQRQGKTILIITHDMSLVAEHCQRVVTFSEGKVAFTGTPAALFTDSEILNRTGLVHQPRQPWQTAYAPIDRIIRSC